MARGSDHNHKGRRSSTLGRALGLMAFMPLASRAPIYARLMLALLVDERTPAARKVAEKAEPGSVILAMLPDTGERYLTTPLFEGIPEGSHAEE